MPFSISVVSVVFSAISITMEFCDNFHAKIPDEMSFVKEGIDKVRSKSWAEPTAMAMNVTASICN